MTTQLWVNNNGILTSSFIVQHQATLLAKHITLQWNPPNKENKQFGNDAYVLVSLKRVGIRFGNWGKFER